MSKQAYEVYTQDGACASHLLFITGAQCRTYYLNDGSTMWVVTIEYESEEALRLRLADFNFEFEDIIETL